MGIYVRSFEQLHLAIESIPSEGQLFAFLLIDSRVNNQSIFKILNYSDNLIDELSASSRIFTFIPFSKWTGYDKSPSFLRFERCYSLNREEKEFLSTIEEKEFSINLSLIIASKFGVKPRELPGIVFFKQFPKLPPQEPIYFSIYEHNLINQESFEKMLIELYSKIQDAWEQQASVYKVLAQIKDTFNLESLTKTLIKPLQNLESILEEAINATKTEERSTGKFSYLTSTEKENIQIFISYAKEDVEFAEFLHSRLRDAGFQPWIDSLNINPGQLWEKAIERGIQGSMFFIACLSSKSVIKRGYLQKEFKYALEKWTELLDDDIYIIPIRLDDCIIPEGMKKFQWIDFFISTNQLGRDYVYSCKGAWIKIMQSITEGARKRNVKSL